MSRPLTDASTGTRAAPFAGEVEFGSPSGAGRGREQRRERGPRGRVDEIGDLTTEEGSAVGAHQLGQPPVGEEDDPALGGGESAVPHVLDDHPVGPVRADQGVQLLTVRAAQHDGVDVPSADRGQGPAQFLDLGAQHAEIVGGRTGTAVRSTGGHGSPGSASCAAPGRRRPQVQRGADAVDVGEVTHEPALGGG